MIQNIRFLYHCRTFNPPTPLLLNPLEKFLCSPCAPLYVWIYFPICSICWLYLNLMISKFVALISVNIMKIHHNDRVSPIYVNKHFWILLTLQSVVEIFEKPTQFLWLFRIIHWLSCVNNESRYLFRLPSAREIWFPPRLLAIFGDSLKDVQPKVNFSESGCRNFTVEYFTWVHMNSDHCFPSRGSAH